MRTRTRLLTVAALASVLALLGCDGGALAQTQRPAPRHPHAHGAHPGVRHPRPPVVWGPPAAPVAPSLSPIEPIAPAPRPYGGCIPTAPSRDPYGGVVSGGC